MLAFWKYMWYNIKAIRMNGLRGGSPMLGVKALMPLRGYTFIRITEI